MTPNTMAALHKAAFKQDRNWSAQEFTDLLTSPFVATFAELDGFALTRTVAGESELLTLAVDPAHHRKGIARRLIQNWLAAVAPIATTAFLEVASDNHPALALYHGAGFDQVAVRSNYYQRKNAPTADAIVLNRALTSGPCRES